MRFCHLSIVLCFLFSIEVTYGSFVAMPMGSNAAATINAHKKDGSARKMALDGSAGKTILVIGACCLDRSIPIESYPQEDAKIRSTPNQPIVESGGGNGANTACAIARLSPDIRVRLLTKIGDDAVGRFLMDDLAKDSVDLSSDLFCVVNGATTSMTHILVASGSNDNVDVSDNSRTCIHTPGSCGELKPQDIEIQNLGDTEVMERIFDGVIHFHSDSRHTEVARILAVEAKRRGIKISVDAEKDRGAPHFDALLNLADILFTNNQMCGSFLRRQIVDNEDRAPKKLDSDNQKFFRLTHFFKPTSSFQDKRVIATRGRHGSLFAYVRSSVETHGTVEVGIDKGTNVVDTTGAGDAFIGSFIAFLYRPEIDNLQGNKDHFLLRCATWVAGLSIEGIGRGTYPNIGELRKRIVPSNDLKDIESFLQSIIPLGTSI